MAELISFISRRGNLQKIKVPLSPLKTQQQIVAQIEEEQKLVEANNKLVELYEQKTKDVISEI